MAAPTTDTIAITAQCLCKANTFTAEVPQSRLPLRASICHCDSCRNLLGALYTIDIDWPTPAAEVDVSKLKAFHFSPKVDLLFCPTCSSPMFWAFPQDKGHLLGAFTGTLSNEATNLITFADQIFVEDTLDGGASVWLQHSTDGSKPKRFKIRDEGHESDEVPQNWPSPSALTGYEARKDDSIPIQCKCKGVDLVLHRGDYSGKTEKELPWNVDPKTHKLLAGFCACDSCRLQGGVDVFNWAFAEMKYLSFKEGDKPFPTSEPQLKELVDAKDPALGTLTYYSSRDDVDRYFCSNCSACIFYATSSRPEIIDIAIGVLRASDGARAEGFLSWPYGVRISYREDGDGGWREKLLDNVEKNAEEYRIARGYPKNWARIRKDNKK